MPRRLAMAPIDVLAVVERLPGDTLLVAALGGTGPGTVRARPATGRDGVPRGRAARLGH
ncbi:hypothetical protein [Roseomonas sp. KE2513]|uniref:hypothetical protein n=1 Tax=Roseomonas sp. KE2513 TaxID=2479202 RepID=UPI0018DFDD12|nr:hypothetical protein [Roseomonas sp. KE2513]